MQVALRIQPKPQQRLETRALQTLLAVNALLPLPIEAMLTRIEEELATNPALQRDPYLCAQCGSEVEGLVCPRCGYSVVGVPGRSPSTTRRRTHETIHGTTDPLTLASRPPSLLEHLEALLVIHVNDPYDRRIGAYLLGCLDERGYFDGDLTQVAADLRVPVPAVERALRRIQTLDPPGAGARSLQECLLIQLDVLPAGPLCALAKRIVSDHLPQIARGRHEAVAEKLATTVEELQQALHFIRHHLAPSPADQFAAEYGDRARRPDEIAVPDIVLTKSAQGYHAELNGAAAFCLRVDPLLDETQEEKGRSNRAPRQAERPIQHQIKQARFFVETIRRRNSTLRRCVEYIISVQSGFLDYGPAHLRPLTMSDVARAVNLAESTVSRALSGKFVQVPNGRVTSFSTFFDRGARTKQRIKDLIASEDPKRPRTDSELARALMAEGLVVARRTVAKYRDELRLPAWGRRGATVPDHRHLDHPCP